MRHIRLRSFEDQDLGEVGLGIVGMKLKGGSAAMRGLLIAHDLLEHQNGIGAIGSVGDELEALGGVWYVRGQHDDINRNCTNWHAPEVHIASDVINLARYFSNGAPLRVRVPKTREHFQDDAFREIIEIAKSHQEESFEGEGQYYIDALHLMRAGYNKAQTRFGNSYKCMANSQFWSIAEAVDRHAKHLDYEGQEFRLSYGKGEARCCEVMEDEWGNWHEY
jgi:hypothetical protein